MGDTHGFRPPAWVSPTLRAGLIALGVGAAWPAASAPPPGSLPPPVAPTCISSPFGLRVNPGPHSGGFHNGIDFPAAVGAWVLAVADGEVAGIRRLGSSGLEIDVAHRDAAGPYVTRYAHLGTVSPALQMGRRAVRRGERLGRVGRTGITHGTHVHFELHVAGSPVDPEPFFAVARCGGPPRPASPE